MVVLRVSLGYNEKGQTEKNSMRAYVFGFALELGHYSMQSAIRIRAKPEHANCPTIAMNADEFGRTNQSDHHVL